MLRQLRQKTPWPTSFSGKSKLVFLGLDFTQAKYIGKIGFTDPMAIQNQHIVSWNNLIELEPKKFSCKRRSARERRPIQVEGSGHGDAQQIGKR